MSLNINSYRICSMGSFVPVLNKEASNDLFSPGNHRAERKNKGTDHQ